MFFFTPCQPELLYLGQTHFTGTQTLKIYIHVKTCTSSGQTGTIIIHIFKNHTILNTILNLRITLGQTNRSCLRQASLSLVYLCTALDLGGADIQSDKDAVTAVDPSDVTVQCLSWPLRQTEG